MHEKSKKGANMCTRIPSNIKRVITNENYDKRDKTGSLRIGISEEIREEELDFEPEDVHSCVSSLTKEINISRPSSASGYLSSSSHTSEMLHVYTTDNSIDRRQSEYLPVESYSSDLSVCLDSSSGSDEKSQMTEDLSSVGSDYDISAEEESRLLSSGEDLDEEDPFRNKVVCVQPSNQITITVSNLADKVDISRTLKRAKDDIKNICETSKKKPRTKKQWTVAFPNECEPFHLCLKDVGYLSDNCNEDESRNSVSSSSSHTSTDDTSAKSLKMTLNTSGLREVEETALVNTSGLREVEETALRKEVPNNKGLFKMPLPPVKRPPTRPRRSNLVTGDGSTANLTETDLRQMIPKGRRTTVQKAPDTITVTRQEDDTISIVASSIGCDDTVESITQENETIKEEVQSYHSYDILRNEENPQESFENLDPDRRISIEQWVRDVSGTAIAQSSNPPDHRVEKSVTNLLPSVNRSGKSDSGVPRLDFKTVHPYFNGLCFYYFFNNNCVKYNCNKFHTVPEDKFVARCGDYIPNELRLAYEFALQHKTLYKDIYRCFIKGFCKYNMHSDLVGCVKHFFAMEIDASEAITLVVNALQACGITLLESVEMISFNTGFMQYPRLGDILLNLLSRDLDISQNWAMIRKIAKILGYMPPEIATAVLRNLTLGYPPNKPLCLDVYNTIIKEKRTDVSQVDQLVLTPLYTLLKINIGESDPLPTGFTRLSNTSIQVQTISPLQREINVIETRTDRGPLRQQSIRFAKQPPPSYDSCNSSSRSCSHSPQDRMQSQYIPQKVAPRNRKDNHLPQVFPRKINLLPEKPIVGMTQFCEDFQLNVSLHHLLPKPVKHQASVVESDVIRLQEAIRSADGATFLKLFEGNKNPATFQNFIAMTIVHLKPKDSFKYFMGLFQSVSQEKHDFASDLYLKVAFEVIVMNLLIEFEKKSRWDHAQCLIEQFLDWDSLVSSQLLQMFGSRNISHMGRYILLAKLLAMGNNIFYTYQILQNTELGLLQHPPCWPLAYAENVDVDSRNAVLDRFFEKGYIHNVVMVADLFKRLLQCGTLYDNCKKHLNRMLITLMDKDRISGLDIFHSHIDIFHSEMETNVLRAFAVLVSKKNLTADARVKLFELCCERNIYTPLNGTEKEITVRLDMQDSELHLILNYFFHKLSQFLNQPVCYDVYVEIKLLNMKNIPAYPKVLKHSARSVTAVNSAIKTILLKEFQIETDKSELIPSVVIPGKEIYSWMKIQQRLLSYQSP